MKGFAEPAATPKMIMSAKTKRTKIRELIQYHLYDHKNRSSFSRTLLPTKLLRILVTVFAHLRWALPCRVVLEGLHE